MGRLVFNAEKHIYTLNGITIPSVTGIIKDAGLYGNTSFYDDYSRERGSLVHKIIQWHLLGELDEASIDPVLQPYFNAWLKFEHEAGYVADVCEHMEANTFWHFAGTIDHIGHLNGHYCIIDVKTGAYNPAWAIQLAAYGLLLKSAGAKRFSLQLKNNGAYTLTEHKDRQDKDVFLAALSIFYWKQNNQIKEEGK